MSQGNVTEAAKRAAGVQAAQMARSGWIIGLGTGSTAYYAVQELGRLIREDGLQIAGAVRYGLRCGSRVAGVAPVIGVYAPDISSGGY